jgi:MoaA/NifB/PqqE/SkfB family radical SAM enzyme
MHLERVRTLRFLQILHPFTKEIPIRQLWKLYRSFKNERPHWFNNQVRINTFFPPYPSVSYDRFFKIIIERKRVPYQAYVAMTSACPYRCPHCSYGRRSTSQLPTNHILKMIRDLKSLGGAIIGFTGGEPLLHKDLEVCVAAAAPQLTTVLFTTGYHLDAERAQKLAQAGIGTVVISLESTNPKYHDIVRGKSESYEEALAAIQICTDTGIYTAIETIGTREKIQTGELDDIYELGRRLHVGEIRILSPVAAGLWAGHPEVMLQPEELDVLKKFHIRHNRSSEGPCVASSAYIESELMFGCNGGYHHLYVDAAGEVSPCDLTPLSFGNITTEPLQAIWERMGHYFPKPRARCLMGEVAEKITTEQLPLPPDESIKLMNELNPKVDLPVLYQWLLKE